MLRALEARDGLTVGQLHRDVFPGGDVDRRSLEHVLGGLVRVGAVRLEDDSFVKDGAPVHFQRVRLTGGGGAEGEVGFTIAGGEARASRRRGASAKSGARRGARKKVRPKGERRPAEARERRTAAREPVDVPRAVQRLFEALREWRLGEARRVGVPAFRVMNDRTLLGVASEAPRDEGALLRVAGVGPGVVKRYGRALIGIVARYAPAP